MPQKQEPNIKITLLSFNKFVTDFVQSADKRFCLAICT